MTGIDKEEKIIIPDGNTRPHTSLMTS